MKRKAKRNLLAQWWRKIKGKFRPISGYEGPKGEYRYSCTLSLTSALDGVGSQGHVLAALPPGKPRYPLYRRLGGPQCRSGRWQNISPQPGFDPPNRSARSESLHQLSYPGPQWWRRVLYYVSNTGKSTWCLYPAVSAGNLYKECSLSYGVPVRERYGSTLLPATREQHDQNCTQSH